MRPAMSHRCWRTLARLPISSFIHLSSSAGARLHGLVMDRRIMAAKAMPWVSRFASRGAGCREHPSYAKAERGGKSSRLLKARLKVPGVPMVRVQIEAGRAHGEGGLPTTGNLYGTVIATSGRGGCAGFRVRP